MPLPSENSAEEPSEGRVTPPRATKHDDAMARALQMMAEAMGTLNRQNPPIYAPQLPPYPIENLPVFNGSNVTAFLKRYEDIAKYHNFTDKMKIDQLTAHCKTRQRAIIQASKEYSEATEESSWNILRTGLRRRFRNSDKHQQEERMEYFEHWLQQCQARNGLNIREYLQEFQIRSKRCIEAGTVEEEQRGFYLVKGLPLRQATKILKKYRLRTDKPKDFQYKKIRDYLTKRLETEEEARMLNPSEAIKEFEPEVEFKVNQITEGQSNATGPQHTTIAGTTTQNAFRPATLQVPLRNSAPNDNRSQSPPGAAPTKSEVDGLVDKMLQLKLNHMAFAEQPWSFQFNNREAELLNNPVIQAEVRKQTEDRSKTLQPYLPQQSQVQGPEPNSYQTQGYQAQSRYQLNHKGYPGNNNQRYQNPGYGNQSYNNQRYSNANQGYQGRPNQNRLRLTC
jgi:hypothetical protein